MSAYLLKLSEKHTHAHTWLHQAAYLLKCNWLFNAVFQQELLVILVLIEQKKLQCSTYYNWLTSRWPPKALEDTHVSQVSVVSLEWRTRKLTPFRLSHCNTIATNKPAFEPWWPMKVSVSYHNSMYLNYYSTKYKYKIIINIQYASYTCNSTSIRSCKL